MSIDMISGHVFIATSLDGYIARKNGDIDWLQFFDSTNEDHGYHDFISNIDAIVMGRGTYETLSHMNPWPYTLPVIVLSSTLAKSTIPEHLVGKVRFMSQKPEEVMASLEQEGYQHIYIDGGQVVQSFINCGMVNDLIITRLPILLGHGRSLFGSTQQDIRLKHIRTLSFPSGFVQSHYEI